MPVLHRSVLTRFHPHYDNINEVELLPFNATREAEYLDAGNVSMYIDGSLENPRSSDNPRGRHTVFGCAQGTNLYLLGYITDVLQNSHQVSRLRDGGSKYAMQPVPTEPGVNTVHFFAVVGDDLLTSKMLSSRKKFMKLHNAQVRFLFRNDLTALRTISPHHAKLIARSKIRRSLSQKFSN
jgi:hypothetical protein